MIHWLFNALALGASVLTAWWFRNHFRVHHPLQYHSEIMAWYVLSAIIGMAMGAVGFGTLNLHLSGYDLWGKSVIGGLFGGILAVEIFKKHHNMKKSTGLTFIPGLCALIIVGRLGCHLAGLDDMTYGTESQLPWAVDLGDGIKRHPVALYESLAMLLFLAVFILNFMKHQSFWLNNGFATFVLFYAAQRWCWENFKPYAELALNQNLFQILAVIMIIWATTEYLKNNTQS